MTYTAPPELGTKEYDRAVAEARAIARATRDRVMQGADLSVRPQDVREAVKDSMCMAFGLKVDAPHPLAKRMTVAEAAKALVEAQWGPDSVPFDDTPDRTIRAAFSSSAFPDMIGEVAREISETEAASSEPLDALLALTHQMELVNFNPVAYSRVSNRDVPMPDAHSARHYHFIEPVIAAESVQRHLSAVRILWSIQAQANDETDYLRNSVASFTFDALRVQLRQFCELLEANPLLQDGSALFSAGAGNLLTLGAPSETALSSVYSALRAQPTLGGQKSDASPRTMLVPDDMEVFALTLMATLPEDRRLRVIATSYLSDADDWYVFSDPTVFPVVARARAQGAPLSGVTVPGLSEAAFEDAQGKTHTFPGLALEVSHSIGFAPVGRVGVVKVSTS